MKNYCSSIWFRNIKLIIVTFLITILVLPSVIAQPLVQSTIEKTKITIGDPIHISLRIIPQSKEDFVQWPVFSEDLGDLDWIDIGEIDTISNKDSFLFLQQLQITAFDSGNYIIPAFEFTINNEKWLTDSFSITVETIPVDTTQAIREIKDIYQADFSIWDYWEIIAGIIIGIALIILFIYYLKNRKKETPIMEKVSPVDAHVTALRLLSELENKKLWQSGKTKDYYAELSIILRSYIENRFEINALEQTTDELLAEAKKNRSLKIVRKELRSILQLSDLVKFAKAETEAMENENYMEQAKYIIKKTKITHQEEVNK